MSIGGYRDNFQYDLDVELTSLDPELFPVPECLESLKSLPVYVYEHAGAQDYSREFCIVCFILLIVLLLLLL